MRIAAVDLETTNLKAMMGILLCGSFLAIGADGPEGPPSTYGLRLDATNPYDPDPDYSLAVDLRDEIERYNLIVTWNGKMFDIPFLNARLLFHRERPVAPQFHVDLMYYAGYSANRIGSKRLISVQQFLQLPHEKTALDWEVWKRAARGDPSAMSSVVTHCEADVTVLAEAWPRLLPYVKNIHR